MVRAGVSVCPKCGSTLEYYGRVKRILKTKRGCINTIYIRRLRCSGCLSIHRELPEDVLPYKHYESEVIFGVIEGLITSDTLGFEDYPSELTMRRWITQKIFDRL